LLVLIGMCLYNETQIPLRSARELATMGKARPSLLALEISVFEQRQRCPCPARACGLARSTVSSGLPLVESPAILPLVGVSVESLD